MAEPRFTPRERRLIARLGDPYAVQRWLHRLPYNHEPDGPTYRTLRGVLKHGSAHCGEAALAAATILEHHGWDPTVLVLDSVDGLGHVLFLFKDNGAWGTVARSRDPGLHGRRPVYRNLRTLTQSYVEPYVDLTGCITGYGVMDLRDLPARIDWRTSPRNVFAAERAFNQIPLKRLRVRPARVHALRRRYRRFMEAHPDRKPTYYRNRRLWL